MTIVIQQPVTRVIKVYAGPEGPAGAPGPVEAVIFDGGAPDTDFTLALTLDAGGVT